MKKCPHCAALHFDDQDFCYECMQTVVEMAESSSASASLSQQMICIEVAVGDSFSYEARLRKTEGALLSVGSARGNAIVIPQEDVSEHQLDIFFSQGRLWAEDKNAASSVYLNGIPLNGTRSIQPGARITMGNTCLHVTPA